MNKRKDTIKLFIAIITIVFITTFIYINIPKWYISFIVWLGNEEVVTNECSSTY